MKKCIVISDSFKGSLSSREIASIARETIPQVFPGCRVDAIPIADGGEGTAACCLDLLEGQSVQADVSGPWPGTTVPAVYGRFGQRAVIEMASAAGLPLAGRDSDPSRTTTLGVGQLIRHAVEHGCKEIFLGLGGSCTNDGGCGCACALGTRFLDRQGRPFVPVGGTLDQIDAIDNRAAEALLSGIRITLMCDVDNPLWGPDGAACIFAPQKGADAAMVEQLDRNLRHLDRQIRRSLGREVGAVPGAGAAGGMGAGGLAFLGAAIRSGIEVLLDLMDFDRRLEGTDLVITGEGRIDAQSLRGKVISGIARRTRARGVPLVVLAGSIDDSASDAYALGVTAMFSTDRAALPFPDCRPRAARDYRAALLDLLRLLQLGGQLSS